MSGNAFERAACYLTMEEKASRFDDMMTILGFEARTRGGTPDHILLQRVVAAALGESEPAPISPAELQLKAEAAVDEVLQKSNITLG